MFIGCHVSIQDGLDKAPKRAHDLGCEIMQIFSRSPRGGGSKKIGDETVGGFKSQVRKYNIKNTYIHTPYYINLASADNRIRYGSVNAIREELERASLVGAKYVMTHLGSVKDLGVKEGVGKTIEMLVKSLEGYDSSAELLLENSAGAGEIIGDSLGDISDIIKKVDSSSIAGICLDTQHSFASGYDWNDFDKTIEKVDKEIGIKNIKLIHANDSMTKCGSNKDRHEHIGEGLIGKESFEKIVEFAEKNDIDMILETKHDKVKEDINILKEMRKDISYVIP
jgi:deoxyribonuclease-4